MRESTPSFGEEGELLVGLPLLALGIFWTCVLGVLLRTPLLLVGGSGLGGPLPPITASAFAAQGIISLATKITTRVRRVSVEIRPILGGVILLALTWGRTCEYFMSDRSRLKTDVSLLFLKMTEKAIRRKRHFSKCPWIIIFRVFNLVFKIRVL